MFTSTPLQTDSCILSEISKWVPHLFKNHPLDAGQTAHLSRSVDGRHSVLSSSVEVAAGLVDEVLEHVEVAFLGGKVHRRHSVLHPRVGTARGGRCDQCKIED